MTGARAGERRATATSRPGPSAGAASLRHGVVGAARSRRGHSRRAASGDGEPGRRGPGALRGAQGAGGAASRRARARTATARRPRSRRRDRRDVLRRGGVRAGRRASDRRPAGLPGAHWRLAAVGRGRRTGAVVNVRERTFPLAHRPRATGTVARSEFAAASRAATRRSASSGERRGADAATSALTGRELGQVAGGTGEPSAASAATRARRSVSSAERSCVISCGARSSSARSARSWLCAPSTDRSAARRGAFGLQVGVGARQDRLDRAVGRLLGLARVRERLDRAGQIGLQVGARGLVVAGRRAVRGWVGAPRSGWRSRRRPGRTRPRRLGGRCGRR